MSEARAALADLRSAYPVLQPDPDYPPLQLASIRDQVSPQEWAARVDCACAYRLVKHFGMDDLIYNHISVKIPGTEEFLLNAFGLTYDEITASSLVRINLAGEVLWAPEFPPGLGYRFNPAGWVIHAAIHEALPAVHGVVHTHSLATMAVSALPEGLLPITQTAMRFDKVAYHDYEGVAVDPGERGRLVRDLGDADLMFLRNHGVLTVGRSIAEAFNNTYRVERACRAQLMAQAAGQGLVVPPADVIEKTHHAYRPGTRRPYGVLEWPAMRRLADRIDPSYRT
ncbi:MAG: class II aldolase/adducin family protein [Betaproteobacteria bacterium]|nr:class II aldolase/adducin family protein [Betaproteobacteria bacterium]